MAQKPWKVNLNDPGVWGRRLTVAKHLRDVRARELRWEDAYEAYRGRILADTPTEDTVVVNFPQAFISNMLPSVYFSQPRIQVRPTQEAYREAAQFMEPLLNFSIRQMRFGRQARIAIQDMLLIGHGWLKMGWATKYGEVPGPEQGAGGNEPLSAVDKTADRQIHFEPGRPFSKRIHPYLMLVDPSAASWEEVRWIAQMAYKPYQYLMEDPYLRYTDQIKPGYVLDSDMGYRTKTESERRETENEGYALVYEIWDLDSRKTRILAEGAQNWQRTEQWPYEFMLGHSFYLVTASDPTDDIYPHSPMMQWYQQVQELSKIRTAQLDALYRARGKIVVEKGSIDNDELEKLRNPLEDVIVVRDINKVTTLRTPTVDPNLYICEDRVKRDILDISGLSELQYGNIPGGRVTATVGLIAQKASAIRTRRIIDSIKEWMLDIGRDLALMLAHRMPEETQVAITTETGQDWITIARADIQGEFLFDMDVTEMAPLSREARQKEALDLLAATQNAPEAKRRRFLTDLLEAYGRTSVDAYLHPDLGPPADPGYENEMLIQGIEVLPNPAEDFELHLQVHGDFMEGDLYQRVATDVPAIRNVFASHVQRTIALAQQIGVNEPAAPAGATGGYSPQRGRPLATSQPLVASQSTGEGP